MHTESDCSGSCSDSEGTGASHATTIVIGVSAGIMIMLAIVGGLYYRAQRRKREYDFHMTSLIDEEFSDDDMEEA